MSCLTYKSANVSKTIIFSDSWTVGDDTDTRIRVIRVTRLISDSDDLCL